MKYADQGGMKNYLGNPIHFAHHLKQGKPDHHPVKDWGHYHGQIQRNHRLKLGGCHFHALCRFLNKDFCPAQLGCLQLITVTTVFQNSHGFVHTYRTEFCYMYSMYTVLKAHMVNDEQK